MWEASPWKWGVSGESEVDGLRSQVATSAPASLNIREMVPEVSPTISTRAALLLPPPNFVVSVSSRRDRS